MGGFRKSFEWPRESTDGEFSAPLTSWPPNYQYEHQLTGAEYERVQEEAYAAAAEFDAARWDFIDEGAGTRRG
jgi:hypothetical protein